MPYSNIHWIKLEKRLLNDYRFYSMSEEAQLIYVKFLMLAAETDNKIPKNNGLIKSALRSKQTDIKIEECIKEIKTNFPKFKENKEFYFFREWGTRCNWIANKGLQGNSEGTPKVVIEKNRIDKIRIEYIRIRGLDIKNFSSDDFNRTARAIKTLLIKSKLKDDLVINSIEWAAKQSWCDWTLETIIRRWPDFMKLYKPRIEYNPADPDCRLCHGHGHIYIANTGETKICECRIKK